MSRRGKKISKLQKHNLFLQYFIRRAERQIERLQNKNTFCIDCKEKNCLVSFDGTCAMIRKYHERVSEH